AFTRFPGDASAPSERSGSAGGSFCTDVSDLYSAKNDSERRDSVACSRMRVRHLYSALGINGGQNHPSERASLGSGRDFALPQDRTPSAPVLASGTDPRDATTNGPLSR